MMIINPDASIAEIAVMLASFAEAALLSPAIVRTTSLPAMAASYDPDPTQFLGIRLPVTLATCEVIAERWANWSRQDPVVAVETQADNLRRLKALRIDCGERDQFNLLYGARRFVRRSTNSGSRIATRNSPTTTAASITGWTRASRFSRRRLSGSNSAGLPESGKPAK